MGAAISTTWDPVPPGWGVNNEGNIDSSSMDDAFTMTTSTMVDSQTQYYSEAPTMSSSTSVMTDYIRIGASGYATLSSSTIVLTTYTESTYTSNSHTLTTSYPITTTEVTLVPMPTQSAMSMTMSSEPSRRNIAAIVAVSVLLPLLLIAALVAWMLLRRRRQRQSPISGSGSSFFPGPLVSGISPYTDSDRWHRSSVPSIALESSTPNGDRLSVDQLDQLDHSAPPLQVESPASIPEPMEGLFLRYSMDTLGVTSSSGGHAFSDMLPHSPTPSSINSSATRQEQLASEVDMVRQEIMALEKRCSAPRDVEEGYVGDDGQRIRELQARIRELEREQASLRLELETEVLLRGIPPPEYASREG